MCAYRSLVSALVSARSVVNFNYSYRLMVYLIALFKATAIRIFTLRRFAGGCLFFVNDDLWFAGDIFSMGMLIAEVTYKKYIAA